MNQTTKLDVDELMHLALHAANKKEPEKAIGHLKELLDILPKNGKAYYLLGALHAEIGMYERAIEEMAKAVELDPNIPTAHFQLGLLYITSARVEEAKQAWKPLDKLGEKDPLFLFKRGMLALAQDDFAACIADLRLGISLNKVNPSLNNDMQKIITASEEALNQKDKNPQPQKSATVSKLSTDKEPAESSKKAKAGKHVLSAYRQHDETDK
jgi:tetratricopeptide (TPR) repeat protein